MLQNRGDRGDRRGGSDRFDRGDRPRSGGFDRGDRGDRPRTPRTEEATPEGSTAQ
jgi:hypothetical protein